MKFEYLARTSQGETQAGLIEASNETVALKTLQEHRLIVLRLRPADKGFILLRKIKIFSRVNKKEMFVFFRQLAILVEAGVPLIQSLRALGGRLKNALFREIVFEVAEDIDGGASFSKALNRYPNTFSPFCINLIKTGEVSGSLQKSLTYLADYLEKQHYLASKVRNAMIYPLFILAVFVVVTLLVVTMVMPTLTTILIETGQELPLSTRILIGTNNFFRNWGWLALVGLVVAGFLLFRYRKTTKLRIILDRIELKLPILGGIFRQIYLARLADTLSVLIKGGVSLLRSLSVAGEVVGSMVFQRIIFRARDEVKAGRSISDVLESYRDFPPIFCQMVRIGEKTGKLDYILDKLSTFYSKEVESIVNNLSQLIEPILIVCLAMGVAVLVFAVFMPIYGLVGAF